MLILLKAFKEFVIVNGQSSSTVQTSKHSHTGDLCLLQCGEWAFFSWARKTKGKSRNQADQDIRDGPREVSGPFVHGLKALAS